MPNIYPFAVLSAIPCNSSIVQPNHRFLLPHQAPRHLRGKDNIYLPDMYSRYQFATNLLFTGEDLLINIEDSALDLKRWNLIIQKAVIEILGEDQAEAIISLVINRRSQSFMFINSLEKWWGIHRWREWNFVLDRQHFASF